MRCVLVLPLLNPPFCCTPNNLYPYIRVLFLTSFPSALASKMSMEPPISPPRRARKHSIDFLIDPCDSPVPNKRERLLEYSSPVSEVEPMPNNGSSEEHQAALSLASLGTTISCSECSFTSTTDATIENSVVAHARIHHPHKPNACPTCGRCFGERGNMNKHYRTVHLKQRRHICLQCSRQFAFLDGLKRHISMVHLDRRPFECTHCLCETGPHDTSIACTHVCGMRFKQKSHHRRHVRSVHQGVVTPAPV